jgi:hypothetical protein
MGPLAAREPVRAAKPSAGQNLAARGAAEGATFLAFMEKEIEETRWRF